MTVMPSNTGASARHAYDRYTVLKLLGEGGMGRVYLAEDPFLQRRVALKVIPVDQHVDRATREDYLKRFAVEAKALAQLNHQSIVTVFDAGEEKGEPWIAFEFVEGETLESVLRREIKLPLTRALSIALDIASALGHAHAKKIIHRDVKPANILIEQGTGIAKLTDFGVAKAPWAMLTQPGNALGSPGYMSPEQIEGYELDERSDLFGLGVVLYEMLAGQHPFVRDTVASTAFATVSGSYVPLHEVRDESPPEVEETVTRCLAPRREDRITSQEFMERLRPFAQWTHATGAIPAVPEMPPASPAGKVSLGTDLQTGARIGARMAARGGRLLYRIGRFVFRTARAGAPHLGRLIPPEPREKIVRTAQFAGHAVQRLRSALPVPRMGHAFRMQLIAALCLALFAGTAVATFRIVTLLRSRVSYEDALLAGLNPARQCADWPSARVVSACRILLRRDNAPLADSIATFLAKTRKTAAAGAALKGGIALRSEEYREARASFEFAASLPGGKRALRQERDAILDDFTSKIAKNKAPEEFIDIMAELLRAGESPTVRAWTGNEEYWLRWNAVRILQAARKRVDMVPVYIQDLEHSGGMRSRIDAVEQLGELKDKRAVPHLRKAAAKGWRDPFVAAAAKEALEENFGK